jgi:regulator of cell morphogenesis and NO signaling
MMITVDVNDSLADLVTRHPGVRRHLEALGLDYCCGGQRTLATAAEQAGLDLEEVLATLLVTEAEPEAADWASMGPAELVDHLEATHHTYLHSELPRLGALVDKVVAVHGQRHPELEEVASIFGALRADLEPHLLKEERVLFPMIRELAESSSLPEFHCGSLTNPIRVMLAEHDQAGELLARLRGATGGYVVPHDACASYRALYDGLAELESDTHLHVHKENNLLFPAVLAMESELARAAQ